MADSRALLHFFWEGGFSLWALLGRKVDDMEAKKWWMLVMRVRSRGLVTFEGLER